MIKKFILFIIESGDVKKDIGYILDFIIRVKCLKVGIYLLFIR